MYNFFQTNCKEKKGCCYFKCIPLSEFTPLHPQDLLLNFQNLGKKKIHALHQSFEN